MSVANVSLLLLATYCAATALSVDMSMLWCQIQGDLEILPQRGSGGRGPTNGPLCADGNGPVW